jgi:hypothetical protein
MHTVANPTVGDPVFREKGRSASNQVGDWSDGRFGWIERQIKLTNLDIVFIIRSFAHASSAQELICHHHHYHHQLGETV